MTDGNCHCKNKANALAQSISDCPKPIMEFNGFGKAYVPQQMLCTLHSAKDGFVAGTIFPELDIPYVSCRAQNMQSMEGCNDE